MSSWSLLWKMDASNKAARISRTSWRRRRRSKRIAMFRCSFHRSSTRGVPAACSAATITPFSTQVFVGWPQIAASRLDCHFSVIEIKCLSRSKFCAVAGEGEHESSKVFKRSWVFCPHLGQTDFIDGVLLNVTRTFAPYGCKLLATTTRTPIS